MQWTLQDRGFLPKRDPLTRLTDPAFCEIERLGGDLPRLVHERQFRTGAASYLTESVDWSAAVKRATDAELERLFMLFSYFASAFVHSPGLPSVDRIPSCIAVPLVFLADTLQRPPILSYASYCLHNWRRIDSSGPIVLGNIALLQNFSIPGDGKSDEDWFILVHVDIEARAGAALQAVGAAPEILDRKDVLGLTAMLDQTANSLHAMNTTMNRMPEGCSADVYFRKVRPYIFGFNTIVYEGCFGNVPQSYRGETGAQSSIVPTMLMALGIQHQNSLLTEHLRDMQNYMPAPHRDFIRSQVSVRDFAGQSGDARVKDRYNACVSELLAFRTRHFEYAVNYIEKKVDNPIATGGTPYIPWLRQLIEETKAFMLA